MTIKQFFIENNKVALAFSGGADSSLLLWAAHEYGADITAYFAKTPFQPLFELRDAEKLSAEIGVTLKLVELSPLENGDIRRNGSDRCYHCKKEIFGAIIAAAHEDGYELIIDGTNASDDEDNRPGMRALRELGGALAPEGVCNNKAGGACNLSQGGAFTGDKPAYACLATRVPTGTAITAEALGKIECGETILSELGFCDFRLRLRDNAALVQLTVQDIPLAMNKRRELVDLLKPYFNEVYLDMTERTASL